MKRKGRNTLLTNENNKYIMFSYNNDKEAIILELDRLLKWINDNNLTTGSLADALGMSYDGVYQVLYVRKNVSPGFRMRFIERFGKQVADNIFEPLIISQAS